LTLPDENILSIFEPNAAHISQRINQLKKLIEIGIKMSVRCDPMIYGVTDSNEQLQKLFSTIANTGCKEAAISFLFLRPAITASLKKNIHDISLLNKVLEPFSKTVSLPIGTKNSTGIFLPVAIRKSAFEKTIKIANNFGISAHICGCKNCDITSESCYITRERKNYQPHLFKIAY